MKPVFLTILLFCLSNNLIAQKHGEYSEPIRVIEAWIDAQKDYEQIPSVAAGIVVNQQLIWGEGFGYADVSHKVKANEATLYSICSISKLFTSIAIMQLRDKGKIDLDDSIEEYLPWFNIKKAFPKSGPVTIRSLLTHSSGLPRESDFPYWTDRSFPFPSNEQFKLKLSEQEMLYPTSSVYQYSNLGMSILGELVSAVSGVPYEKYIQENILNPLGLVDTRMAITKDLQYNKLATGYGVASRNGEREALGLFYARGITPAAGFISNVKDLARFTTWNFNALKNVDDPVLNGNTLREMQRVHWMDNSWENARGLGFDIQKLDNQYVVGHSGGCPGYLSQVRMINSKNLGIIVMINAQGEDVYEYVESIYHILNAYEKEKGSDPKVNLEEYSGIYYGLSAGEILITPWKGKLAAFSLKSHSPRKPSFIMEHVKDDIFRFKREDEYAGEEIRFERGKDKMVTKYWRHSGYAEKRH